MKQAILSLIAVLLIFNCFAQQATLILQPDSTCGKDALIWNAPPSSHGSTNYGTVDGFGAHAWRNSGIADTGRSLIQFDLSAIPVGSIISSAYLGLYNNPTTP